MISEIESPDINDVEKYKEHCIEMINSKRKTHFDNIRIKNDLINKEQSLLNKEQASEREDDSQK